MTQGLFDCQPRICAPCASLSRALETVGLMPHVHYESSPIITSAWTAIVPHRQQTTVYKEAIQHHPPEESSMAWAVLSVYT